MPKPLLTHFHSASWALNTSPRVISTDFVISANDVIILLAANENVGGSPAITFSETGAQTPTALSSQNANNTCEVRTASYIPTSTEAVTFSASDSTSNIFGAALFRFADSDGVGNHTVAVDTTGDNTIALTTTQDNSAIVLLAADFTALDGNTAIYNESAGKPVEYLYFRTAANYAVHIAVYPDVGTAGSKTVGLTNPDSTNISLVAIEVKGKVNGVPNSRFRKTSHGPVLVPSPNIELVDAKAWWR